MSRAAAIAAVDHVTGDEDIITEAALVGHGTELRIHPSSKRMPTAAGFVIGRNGGVGSIRHGGLGELRNVTGLLVLSAVPDALRTAVGPAAEVLAVAGRDLADAVACVSARRLTSRRGRVVADTTVTTTIR